jgi:hypothetical protein
MNLYLAKILVLVGVLVFVVLGIRWIMKAFWQNSRRRQNRWAFVPILFGVLISTILMPLFIVGYVTAWAVPPGTPWLVAAIPLLTWSLAALVFSLRYKAKYWESGN